MTHKTKLDGSLRKALISIKDQVHQKRHPAIIIVSGYLNRGKTINTALMCEFLQKDFNPELQIGRGIDQFIGAWEYTKGLKSSSFVKCCVYDEIKEFLRGGNRKKVQEINKIIDTMKQYQTILFLVGSKWWRLNPEIFGTGAVQGYIHIIDWDDKYAYYAFYDAFDTLQIAGEANKAEKNYDYGKAIHVAYRKYLNSGRAMRGFIKLVTPKKREYYDRISDEGKEALQKASAERLKKLNSET